MSLKPRLVSSLLMARARPLFVLAAGCAALGYTGQWHWFAELFSHFFIQYWLAASVLLLLFMVCRARNWVLAALGFWLLCSLALMPFYRSEAPAPGAGAQELTLLQFNVAQRPEALEAWLALQVPVDVVLLMEATPAFEPLLAGLRERFPHQLLRLEEGPFGIALLSRHPFARERVLEPIGSAYPGLDVSLGLEGLSLRLLGIHPPPPLGAQLAGLRDGYMEHLQDELRVAGPTLVVGDFNSTVWSPRLRAFMAATGLQDCQRGLGLAPSWPARTAGLSGLGLGLGIPIDLCLHGGPVRVVERRAGPNLGSDHLPVVNRIAF